MNQMPTDSTLMRPLLASVVAGLATVTTAVASPALGADPMRFDVGAGFGFSSFDEKSGLGNAASAKDVPGAGPALVGHGGTVLLDGRLGLEVDARLALSTLRSGGSSARVLGVRGRGLWYFATDGAVQPFATAGFGYDILFNGKAQCPAKGPPVGDCMYVKTPDVDKAFALGIGARVPLTFRWSLRAQLLYLAADGRPGVATIAHDFDGTVGVAYTFGGPPEDADRDGLADDSDKCPARAEDKDGFEDSDGCPEDDNDNDGVLDDNDRCANVAEDKDGFEDNDGCPDLDNDGDGIPDATDKCPDKPETKNGFQDDDGCPDVADSDGDGIVGAADKCPNQPEDKDGFEDGDGCPEADNDRDGVLDSADKCPNQAETKNGFQDADGCPDQLAPAVAALVDKPVATLEFKGDKLRKGTDAQLTPLLEFMLEHEAVKLAIEVQAESDDDAGKALAGTRAGAIKAWLADQGIDGGRITAGSGPAGAVPKPVKGVLKPLVVLRLL